MPTSVKLKNVVRIDSRGNAYWYYRKRGRPLVRLPGVPGDPAFMAKWAELQEEVERKAPASGTMAHLIATYKASPAYLDLKPLTRKEYDRVLDHIVEKFGAVSVTDITHGFVARVRDANIDRRRFANYIVQIMNRLMNFAVERGVIGHNPIGRIALLKLGDGHQPWDQISIKKAKTGKLSYPYNVSFLIAIMTGQRRANVLGLRWSDYDGESLTFPPQKRGRPVVIPLFGELKELLDKLCPEDREGFILGREFSGRTFSRGFRAACDKVGIPKHLTFHGLRYTAAALYADAGASDEEIMSITGHRSLEMVSRYASKSRGKVRATNAVSKLKVQNIFGELQNNEDDQDVSD